MSGDDLSDPSALREQLTNMEARISRIREVRDAHNLSARRAAEQRDSVQGQNKDLRERINERIEVRDEIRARIQAHKNRRDAIQEQVRALIQQSRKGRSNQRDAKSVRVQFNDARAEVDRRTKRIETSGALTLEDEKKELEIIRRLMVKISDLEPLVKEQERLDVDLDDIEGSIQELRARADEEHQSMVEAVDEVKIVSKELDEMFSERSFLKAEGDRHHASFVSSREKADEVHQKIKDIIDEVTKVKDQLQALRSEARGWMDQHNASVREEMQDGSDSDEIADELAMLLESTGQLSLGGVLSSDPGRRSDPPIREVTKKNKKSRIEPQRRRRMSGGS